MMVYLFLFVLISSQCSAQTETVFTVHKVTPVSIDSTHGNSSNPFSREAFSFPPMDSAQYTTIVGTNSYTQDELNHILGIPPELYLISCELRYDSMGHATKIPWSINDAQSEVALQRVIDAKPKGKFTFANIYVWKGNKKRKLADKIIEVK